MKIRTLVLAMIAAFVLGLGVTEAKEQLFRLFQVSNAADAKRCADQNGLAALLFTLLPDGNLHEPVGAGCITPDK